MNLADKMPIQHWITTVSQEVKVRIDITYINDRVLLLHVDSTPLPPPQPVLQTTSLTPPPPIYNLGLNYGDLMGILLFLAFFFGMFISDRMFGVFFAIISKVNFMNNSCQNK